MERNREARRGTMAALNGGGLSRRRQRNSSSFKESPDEDGGMELPETSRLRDRGVKKDLDRDRSSRRKRRRRDRLLHGNNRDEGEESSEESLDEDDEDEEEDEMTLRHPSASLTTSSSSSQHQLQPNHHNHHYTHHHHHHHQQPQYQHQQQQPQPQRKSFPSKVVRPQAVWTADEMIGVTVPRKARSASVKRSHEYSVSGVAGGSSSGGTGGVGGGDQLSRQPSASPSRLSPASTSQISPSSSNASIRKRMKPASGSKHRPPKISKAPSSMIQDDLEIEVAEVLYGLTRQFQLPAKQETTKVDLKELNGALGNEAKSRVSLPSSFSRPPASHPTVLPPSNSSSIPASVSAVAPKRKKLRPEKFDEESTTSLAGVHNVPAAALSSAAKLEPENPIKMEASSPRSEKNNASSATENGVTSIELAVPLLQAAPSDAHQESAELEKPQVPDMRSSVGGTGVRILTDNKGETLSASKVTPTSLDVNLSEPIMTSKKIGPDSPREEKFKIDLMAPPPGKLSPDAYEICNFDAQQKSLGSDTEMGLKLNIEKKVEEKTVERVVERDQDRAEKTVQKDFDLRKQVVKEQSLDLQLDLEKISKEDIDGSKSQVQKQQPKAVKVETKQEKSASTASMNVPLTVGTWPGGFPPFGYVGQVPSLQAVIPMDAAGGPSNAFQPSNFSMQPRPRRCATHCHIAQTIYQHQKLARMNPFWPAATGTTSMYGKPYNLNILPPSDASLFGNPIQGAFPGKNMSSLHDSKAAPMVAAAYTGHVFKDKMPPANNAIVDASQMKQLVLQHTPQSGSATNMLHGPAFIFPLNQQQAAAAAAAAAVNRAGTTKSTSGACNLVPSTGASSSTTGGSGNSGSATPLNLSFASLSPNEAQYLAFLQNNAYPFTLPSHVAGAPPFRGTNPAQALPFFYPSHMLHPSQLHLQQQQQQAGPPQPSNAQQSHHKPSTSSGSSSSLKHPPQQSQNIAGGVGGTGMNSHTLPATHQRQHLQPPQDRQQESKGTEDNPSTAESRASQVQKGIYGQNFALPIHHQNFTMMSAAAAGNGGGHGDKQPMYQQPQQKQNAKMELASPQTFTMPFASFNVTSSATSGRDFSSVVQNHAIFQSHSEAARQGYHQINTAASFASQAAQQKKAQQQTPEEGKSVVREAINGKMTGVEERKMMPGGKTAGSSLHNSLNFTKSDTGSPISCIPSNSVPDSSSQTLNLIQAPANGNKPVNRSPSTAVPSSSSADMATINISTSQQHQQQLVQLHKQQQQQLQLQLQQQLTSSRPKTSVSSHSASAYSERLPGASTLTKYPQTLTAFPQALMQGSSPNPSSQTKASTGRIAPPSTTSPSQAVGKGNHMFQQQGRSAQQPIPTQSHQTQISFGMNSLKMVPSGGQHPPGGTSNPSPSVAAIAVGPPSSSVSKNAGGNQLAPANSKPSSANSVVPLSQQSSSKQSAVSASSKSSPASSMPSILGHPQNALTPNSVGKLQQQQQQQQQQQSQHSQKQHPFPQAQLFFSNPYLQQPHSVQPNTAAANYYQKRQPEQPTQQQCQQQHQLSSVAGSTGMLAISSSPLPLSGASPTSDPAKAMAAAAAAAATANSMKGLQQSAMHVAQLAAVAQSASGSPHPHVPATFPYVSMPTGSAKAASGQKPAAGGDNLHSCWQPEKR